MKKKKILGVCMAALLAFSVFVIPAKAAAVTDAAGTAVTTITATNVNSKNATTYTANMTTVTDHTAIIPVEVKTAGRVMIDLEGVAVGRGVTVSLHTKIDATDASEVGYNKYLSSSGTEDTLAVEISKAGTYYLKFDTTTYGESEAQQVVFKAQVIPNSGTLTSGKSLITTNNGMKNGISYYKVTAPSTGYFKLKVGTYNEENLYSVYANIYSSKKKAYGSESEYIGGSNEYTAVFAVPKGTYYIGVKGTSDAMTVKQTFTSYPDQTASSKSKAVSLKKGQTKKGVVLANESKTKADWLKFYVPSSQFVNLEVKASSSIGTLKYEIYSTGKNTSSIQLSTYGLNETKQIQPYTILNNNKLKPGTYYIKITGNKTGDNGYYSIRWK